MPSRLCLLTWGGLVDVYVGNGNLVCHRLPNIPNPETDGASCLDSFAMFMEYVVSPIARRSVFMLFAVSRAINIPVRGFLDKFKYLW